MSSQNTAFIVLNWNCLDTILECLSGIMLNSSSSGVFLVDNASTDRSLEAIRSNFPGINILTNSANIGFSAGVNVGIKHAESLGFKYVALINADAVITENWRETLEKVLDNNSNIGICTGKLINPSTQCIDTVGDSLSDWLLPYLRGEGFKATSFLEPGYVSSGSAAASLYRIKMLNEIGYFDEKFFLYYEDSDVGCRSQLAGYRAFYDPNATGEHERSSSSIKVPKIVVQQSIRNRHLLVLKNVPFQLLLRHGYKYIFSSFLFFLNHVRKGYFVSTLSSVCEAFKLTPYALTERARIQQSRKITPKEFEDRMITPGPPPIRAIEFLSKFMK